MGRIWGNGDDDGDDDGEIPATVLLFSRVAWMVGCFKWDGGALCSTFCFDVRIPSNCITIALRPRVKLKLFKDIRN